MSGILPRHLFGGIFNRTGSAGPRRLLAIGAGTGLVLAAIFGAASIRSSAPPVSRPGALPRVDPIPGGLHSNTQQDTLSVIDNQEKAARAAEVGASFTPVMPASRPYTAPRVVAVPTPTQLPPPTSHPAQAAATPPAQGAAMASASPQLRAIQVAATGSPPAATAAVAQSHPRAPQDDAAFKAALDRMMAGWGGRPPRTEIILPPEDTATAESGGPSSPGQTRRHFSGNGDGQAAAPTATRVSTSSARQTVLVPAGRGIYAHTVLAANSDAQSPVVLQADSGPIAGDRMIGTFSRERDRLVIRVTKVIHQNQEIGVDGVVVAPGSMEVGVASSVDQNYLSRWALPAAAAFVQGLGQAIAQSNSTSVLGPLGSVTTQNQLNIDQQIGIAAGVAAAQIGSTLQQSAPHGSTVTLDVGASVGVLFLTNVSASN